MTIFTIDGVDNIGVKTITLKNKNGAILLEDEALIYHNYTTPPKRSKLTGNLNLSTHRGEMILSGTFTTRSLDFRDHSSYNGIIRLFKTKAGTQSKLIARLNQMNLSNSLSFIQPKQKEKETVVVTVVETTKAEPSAQKPKDAKTVSATANQIKSQETFVPLPATASNKTTPPPEIVEPEKKLELVSKSNTTILPVSKPAQKNTLPGANTITRAKGSIVPENAAAKLASREIETIRSVFFTSDSLVISLFDNGQVDGDTVSVILNNKIIIARQELNEKAITTTLYITPDLGDSLQLVLFAENLGSIPPNTGLLTVKDGNDRYEIRFTGDLQKNSAIILRRKK